MVDKTATDSSTEQLFGTINQIKTFETVDLIRFW